MGEGEYKVLHVTDELIEAAKSDGTGQCLRAIWDLIKRGRTPQGPEFAQGMDCDALLREHKIRAQVPKTKPKMVCFMCGRGFEALAALACHFEIICLVECCPHNCEQLRKMFPNAVVICGNIKRIETWKQVSMFQVDVVTISFCCQPSSLANRCKKAEDARDVTALFAIRIAMLVNPIMVICENVAPFKTARPKTYQYAVDTLTDREFRVFDVVTNAAWFGVAAQRNRRFIIGTRFGGKDNEAAEAGVMARVVTQQMATKHGGRTARTPSGHAHLAVLKDLRTSSFSPFFNLFFIS